jgi:hypothetical protein
MPERLPSIEATACKKSACLDKNNILPLYILRTAADLSLLKYVYLILRNKPPPPPSTTNNKGFCSF